MSRCIYRITRPARWLPRSFVSAFLPALLLIAFSNPASAATPAAPYAHVYLFRGLANIFSLGMDQIAINLERQGIRTTVANHLAWPALAEQAAAEYKSGRLRTIIIVGHSAGSAAVTDMVNRLGELRVPVKLAIGLDPIVHEAVTGHVGRYVNYYISTGAGVPVDRTRQFSGVLQNVDLGKDPSVGHFNIDKSPAVEAKVIAQIRAAVYH